MKRKRRRRRRRKRRRRIKKEETKEKEEEEEPEEKEEEKNIRGEEVKRERKGGRVERDETLEAGDSFNKSGRQCLVFVTIHVHCT